MRAILLLFLAAVAASACQFSVNVGKVPPPIQGNPEFGDVVLATEIDSYTKEPITEVLEFASDVETMYATIHVRNAKAGEFRFNWRNGSDEPTGIVMTTPDIYDSWVSTWIEPTDGVPPGDDYSLEVIYNGKVISTVSFRVTGSSRRDAT